METVIFHPDEKEAIHSGAAYDIEHWDLPTRFLWLMKETKSSINRVILKLGFPIDSKNVECDEYQVTVLTHYSEVKEDKRPKRVCLHCGKALGYVYPDDIDVELIDNACVGKMYGHFGSSNDYRIFDIFVCDDCVFELEIENRIKGEDKD